MGCRRCALEGLEPRLAMAGDIHAELRGGDLVIRGDELDNAVEISRTDDGLLRLTGVDGTTIGGAEFQDFALDFDDLVLRLRQGGDDHVAISGELELRGDLFAKMGRGSLLIDGSEGAVTVGENLHIASRGNVSLLNDVNVRGETDIHATGDVYVVAGRAIQPDFEAATFHRSLEINNPYFLLIPGTKLTYQAEVVDDETGESQTEIIVLEVLAETRMVLGVDCRVVRDRVWIDGRLHEDTYDWYAQDDNGNVWYMGESVTNYEYDDAGNFVGTNNAGSFEGGVDGAMPGVAMEANPRAGDRYYQEFAPGIAMDRAEVLALGESAITPAGNYQQVLRTQDTNNMEPDALEHKLYAPGIGLVVAHKLDYLTGEIVETTQLIAAERKGAPLAQVIPTGIVVGSNATGETIGSARFGGDVRIRARGAVIVDGAALSDDPQISSRTSTHVVHITVAEIEEQLNRTNRRRTIRAEAFAAAANHRCFDAE